LKKEKKQIDNKVLSPWDVKKPNEKKNKKKNKKKKISLIHAQFRDVNVHIVLIVNSR
jgi:hypothetical protein